MKNLCYLAALRGTITKEQAAETMRRVGLDPEKMCIRDSFCTLTCLYGIIKAG